MPSGLHVGAGSDGEVGAGSALENSGAQRGLVVNVACVGCWGEGTRWVGGGWSVGARRWYRVWSNVACAEVAARSPWSLVLQGPGRARQGGRVSGYRNTLGRWWVECGGSWSGDGTVGGATWPARR